jgi:glycosyltransferase involved in cell wall biosynthesis
MLYLHLHLQTVSVDILATVLVVIPTYGQFEYAKLTVASLLQSADTQAYRIQYLIVDDASSDWNAIDWEQWPEPDCHKLHFEHQAGLSRSWNAGLRFAREGCFHYAICANSDILFPSKWIGPMIEGLKQGFSLVGPLTNAPGHATWQNASAFCNANVGQMPMNDSEESIATVADQISTLPIAPVEAPLNGFFLMAATTIGGPAPSTKSVCLIPRIRSNIMKSNYRADGVGLGGGLQ